MSSPTQSASVLFSQVKSLLFQLFPGDDAKTSLPQFIRLAGVSTSNLTKTADAVIQVSFDDILGTSLDSASHDTQVHQDTQKAEKTLDDIRKRFGKGSIQFGI